MMQSDCVRNGGSWFPTDEGGFCAGAEAGGSEVINIYGKAPPRAFPWKKVAIVAAVAVVAWRVLR